MSALTLQQLDSDTIAAHLRSGLRFRVGEFVFKVRSDLPGYGDDLKRIYPDYPLVDGFEIADAHVTASRKAWWSGTQEVRYDRDVLLADFPAGQALPHVEWALNWCVATRAHEFVQFHSSALEREGGVVLLPGAPGSGKSTLSTFMSYNGWRLLSDEFGMVRPEDGTVVPFPRLIPLKNESIGVVEAVIPGIRLGPRFEGTRKGTVAHVCPLPEHVQRAREPARPALVVYTRFDRTASHELKPLSKSENFVRLTQNSFNYQLLGLRAFELAANLAGEIPAYSLQYNDAEMAVDCIAELFARVH